jgi:serine/threonine protein kinase
MFTNRSKRDVKIIDFGLSKFALENMTTRIGTPYYVSPEVLTGEKPYNK